MPDRYIKRRGDAWELGPFAVPDVPLRPTDDLGTVVAAPTDENEAPGSTRVAVTVIQRDDPYIDQWCETVLASGVPQPPDAPSALTATDSGDSSVNLTWTGTAHAATYTLKRALVSGGPYTEIETGIRRSETSTTDYDVVVDPPTPYFYVLVAVNSVGESPPSNEASATPTPYVP